MESVVEKINEFSQGIKDATNNAKDLFSVFERKTDEVTADKLLSNFTSNYNAAKEYMTKLKRLAERGYNQSIIQYVGETYAKDQAQALQLVDALLAASDEQIHKLNAIKSTTESLGNEIAAAATREGMQADGLDKARETYEKTTASLNSRVDAANKAYAAEEARLKGEMESARLAMTEAQAQLAAANTDKKKTKAQAALQKATERLNTAENKLVKAQAERNQILAATDAERTAAENAYAEAKQKDAIEVEQLRAQAAADQHAADLEAAFSNYNSAESYDTLKKSILDVANALNVERRASMDTSAEQAQMQSNIDGLTSKINTEEKKIKSLNKELKEATENEKYAKEQIDKIDAQLTKEL